MRWRNTAREFNIAIPLSFLAWFSLSMYRAYYWYIAGTVLFTCVMFLRSYSLYADRKSSGQITGSFHTYVSRRRVAFQNFGAGVLMGLSDVFAEDLILAMREVGGELFLVSFTLFLVCITLFAFFRRPGTERILSRSYPIGNMPEDLAAQLAKKYGISRPEIRGVPSGRNTKANASSWGLPHGRNYIFVYEDLFDILEPEELQSILTHEIAHLKYRHSTKSFFIFALTPLTLADATLAVLFYLPPSYSFLFTAIITALFVLAFRSIRLRVSRRFEKQADVFAARHCDSETYISALRKLARYNGIDSGNVEDLRSTHLSLAEREELVRSV